MQVRLFTVKDSATKYGVMAIHTRARNELEQEIFDVAGIVSRIYLINLNEAAPTMIPYPEMYKDRALRKAFEIIKKHWNDILDCETIDLTEYFESGKDESKIKLKGL